MIQNNKNRNQIESSKTKLLSEQLQPSPGTDDEGKAGASSTSGPPPASCTGAADPQLPLRGWQSIPGDDSLQAFGRGSQFVKRRAWVHFYLMWKGRSGPLAPILAHPLHPTASSCIVVSTDEGLKDGQRLCMFSFQKRQAICHPRSFTQHLFRAIAKHAYGALRKRWNSQRLSEAKVYPYPSWNYTNSYIW